MACQSAGGGPQYRAGTATRWRLPRPSSAQAGDPNRSAVTRAAETRWSPAQGRNSTACTAAASTIATAAMRGRRASPASASAKAPYSTSQVKRPDAWNASSGRGVHSARSNSTSEPTVRRGLSANASASSISQASRRAAPGCRPAAGGCGRRHAHCSAATASSDQVPMPGHARPSHCPAPASRRAGTQRDTPAPSNGHSRLAEYSPMSTPATSPTDVSTNAPPRYQPASTSATPAQKPRSTARPGNGWQRRTCSAQVANSSSTITARYGCTSAATASSIAQRRSRTAGGVADPACGDLQPPR